ncbi:conserved hypothetical protein [Trichormus variabilis ATCC 29413]|uniref:Uncharacterized protein n=2 Tax=Anabaena variabilis TaxID=264691 RepID=Q3M471_TRIV2|nr:MULTISPECIES: hypothetical protein [Nostocaceae]ABA24215.1 conserved hypothetical protein [Trichormus variabilis ATCC 29413]MBC1214033.1 hypothetical protein [Trichormus variabilis ARAD]MBC1257813.1 hypothetical protein [Trichormus variabilis V5]MBC1268407.1 hypothetical protein [Trichormus variabilis FSR]MBC1302507.1 hypothetical protein [Trichormus variabilis N2B]
MRTKIFGFALMLSLAAFLGACEGGGGDQTTPATGEPTDTGAATPAATTPAATTPAASPTTTP